MDYGKYFDRSRYSESELRSMYDSFKRFEEEDKQAYLQSEECRQINLSSYKKLFRFRYVITAFPKFPNGKKYKKAWEDALEKAYTVENEPRLNSVMYYDLGKMWSIHLWLGIFGASWFYIKKIIPGILTLVLTAVTIGLFFFDPEPFAFLFCLIAGFVWWIAGLFITPAIARRKNFKKFLDLCDELARERKAAAPKSRVKR